MSSTENQLNPKDVEFANVFSIQLSRQWIDKFLKGAKEHGGINKPALIERAGLHQDSLQEVYDLYSYLQAREVRIQRALLLLRDLQNMSTSTTRTELIQSIMNLLA